MNNKNPIASSISSLEPFADSLMKLFQICDTEVLYQKRPVRGTKEESELKLKAGRYLLEPFDCKIRPDNCNKITMDFISLLKTYLPEREKDLEAVANVFIKDDELMYEFLHNALCNREKEIYDFARKNNLAEDVTAFIAIYLIRPYRVRAKNILAEAADLSLWKYGYCPICGHWPSLSISQSGSEDRKLWCVHCSTEWLYTRNKCSFCMNEKEGSIHYISPASEESFRIQVCNKCFRYLKEVRIKTQAEKYNIDTIYLGTSALDKIANKEGCIFERNINVVYFPKEGFEMLLYRQELNSVKHTDLV